MAERQSAAESVPIDFEGETLWARPGESLAATLTASGVRTFRTTGTGAPRSVFCGMGVCQDCLVEVDGCANQRACMIKVDRPMRVRREAHARPLTGPFVGTAPEVSIETEYPEILVIGAGPGGLAAARAAARAGAGVVVLDERADPGGQYYKQVSVDGAAPPDRQHREGRDLIDSALAAGAEIRSKTLVWGAFAPRRFVAMADGRSTCYEPKAAIIATGAYERGWPVPGWTLPGVMTTGAVQTLWRTARRLPGRRVLIAGNGPLNLQLASELIEGGAEVVAVVEASRALGLGAIGTIAAMAASSPGLLRDGIGYHRKRVRGRTAMLYDSVITGIAAAEQGLSVTIAGAHNTVETVDVVCLGYGFLPSHELARVLGCRCDFDDDHGYLVTRRDANGATTVPGVYALGDCAGMGGARVALADGTLAGLAAAAGLGHTLSGELEVERQRATADAARHRRFQSALWRLFAPARPLEPAATPETILCRCEEATFADVDRALADGAASIGTVKRLTRAGMGRCQGRYCAPVLERYLANALDRPSDEFSGFAPRVPVKPVTIADLVGAPDRT